MPLNLIADAWIPAVRNGNPTTLRPHEIAEDGVERLAWPRDDLNLACLELLIGLVYLADPPRNDGDWHERYEAPGAERLRNALARFGPLFELTGDGPRFMQDEERFEERVASRQVSTPDMLFIDSAGANTARKNADLTVRRDRYPSLPLPLAAMSLYTLQAFAPSGGRGNRTSMRGGGPMVTLIKPVDGGTHPLWRHVWCNVPEGQPLRENEAADALPWLRPTRTSERDRIVVPDMSHDAEAFFGMPRRLRLILDNDRVTGVVQVRYGTNYTQWLHPLSPYYSREAGGELLPVHPRPGRVSYRNWLGLAFGRGSELRQAAKSVQRYHNLADAPRAEILAGGWAMSNMKPLDFTLHTYPTFPLDEAMDMRVATLVEAADFVFKQLRRSLKRALMLQGAADAVVQETFFAETEQRFVHAIQSIADGFGQEVEAAWLKDLRRTGLGIYDRYVLPGLAVADMARMEAKVDARRAFIASLAKPGGVRRILCLAEAA